MRTRYKTNVRNDETSHSKPAYMKDVADNNLFCVEKYTQVILASAHFEVTRPVLT